MQWRTHGGFRGSTPLPPHWRLKKNENLSFWNDPPFFIQRLPKLLSIIMFFCTIQLLLLYNLEKLSLWCNNTVVKLFWCVALDVDDRRLQKKWILSFLRRTGFSSCGACRNCCHVFFCAVQLPNLIWRNFYYDAMQQYRYSNFSDVFRLNSNFVIDAAVKQFVCGSFLNYDVSAVAMAAHKIFLKNRIFTALVSLNSL